MLTINLRKDELIFEDITKQNLENVLELYNQNEQSMYATGIDRPMSANEINEKYLEVLVNMHEFFIGILLKNRDVKEFIGVIKGRIDYKNSEEAWISSIIIDNKYRNQGIGKKSVNTIIELLNKNYDIKRVFIGIISGNELGEGFWEKLGFDYLRTIEHYIRLNNKTEDFIIMKKEIKKQL